MIREVENIQNTKEIVSVNKLRDIEVGIITYMLLSSENYSKITNIFSIENAYALNIFTFTICLRIYEYLYRLQKEIFSFMNFNDASCITILKEKISDILEQNHNISKTLTLDILSLKASNNIEQDLKMLKLLSSEKEIALNNNIVEREGTIKTKDTTTSFLFRNERLIYIESTNILKLPNELHDNFKDTFEALEVENGKNHLKIKFYEDFHHPDYIEELYFTKDYNYLKLSNANE